ncbi:hypothetical protein FQN60_009278 [Etheostoma spectabile]|uniref:Uncharacterized protein n=1 Tax=Etheostoma spectabile TaxID=54343 RepID=A0A5J5DII0_9PERO|nr:hypothetical protein FQN60_009278 [Etheostoma spectabile]
MKVETECWWRMVRMAAMLCTGWQLESRQDPSVSQGPGFVQLNSSEDPISLQTFSNSLPILPSTRLRGFAVYIKRKTRLPAPSRTMNYLQF